MVRQSEYDAWRSIPWTYTSHDVVNVAWTAGLYMNQGNQVVLQLGEQIKETNRVLFVIEYTKP